MNQKLRMTLVFPLSHVEPCNVSLAALASGELRTDGNRRSLRKSQIRCEIRKIKKRNGLNISINISKTYHNIHPLPQAHQSAQHRVGKQKQTCNLRGVKKLWVRKYTRSNTQYDVERASLRVLEGRFH